jgi:hypothetical protein
MRAVIAEYFAFTRANNVWLVRFFLTSASLAALYFVTWHFWRWSNLPGFLLLFSSLPWSLPAVDFDLWSHIAWPVRNFVSTVVVTFGFAINSALLLSIIAFIRHKRRRA